MRNTLNIIQSLEILRISWRKSSRISWNVFRSQRYPKGHPEISCNFFNYWWYHQGYLQMSLQILKYRGSLENMFRSVETYILRMSAKKIFKYHRTWRISFLENILKLMIPLSMSSNIFESREILRVWSRMLLNLLKHLG